MREPGFWWHQPGLLARLLAPAGLLYGAAAAFRLARPGRRAGIPVICLGNLTLGGSGKTPAAIAIARLLQAQGVRPAFLTRGYGGRLAGPAIVASTHTAADVGDEPLLLARVAPAVVARDRVAGAAAAAAAGAEVIVMDDGFQNPALAKDASLLVLDGKRGIGNRQVFPAGPLRAPLAAQLARGQALIVVGPAEVSTQPIIAAARAHDLAILAARLVPAAEAVTALRARPVLAFAGIGNPEKLFSTLRGAGVAVAATQAFADHHVFGPAEAAELIARAERDNLALVTTEKDHARMAGNAALTALAARAKVLPVTLVFEDRDAIGRLLETVLKRAWRIGSGRSQG